MIRTRLRSRSGVTLIEMLVAMTILSVLVGVAFSFMRQQSIAVMMGGDQMRVLQNQRFTLSTLEKDLRTAGVGVVAGQPFLVYADSEVVAFNADFVTRDLNERLNAVYIDSSAAPAAVTAATRSSRFTIPRTNLSYPDTSYFSGAGNSPAETVIFFFTRDTTTARADDYALYRQVNGLTPEPVARNLLKAPGLPFLRYYRRVAPAGEAERLDTVPRSRRLFHSAALHASARDTGSAALVDSVRAVEINLRTTSGEPGRFEQQETVRRIVQLPNAGIARLTTCGAKPALGTALAAQGALIDGEPGVRLSWSAALDEVGGERDALRYVLWRKRAAADPWGDPLTSLSTTGAASYAYEDRSLEPSATYFYSLAVQDCTPSLSGTAVASTTTPAAP